MSLPADVRALITEVLTQPQRQAFELEAAGLGTRSIALHLGLSRSAVRDRLWAAHDRLLTAGIRQDGSGRWHIQRAA